MSKKVEIGILERRALRAAITLTLDDEAARSNLKQWEVKALNKVMNKIPAVRV